jgi:hypothetical protein
MRLDEALTVRRVAAPPEPASNEPVRRAVQVGELSAHVTPPGGEQSSAGAGPDIEALADRVFDKLRERLRVERERLGGSRFR